MLKLDKVPENAARVRLAIPDKGFLRGDDLLRTGGAQDWNTYAFPVPGSALGNAAKVTVFFYDDQMGSGTIGIDAVSLKAGKLPPGDTVRATVPVDPDIALIGDTNRPDTSTFAHGESVDLTFT